LVGYLGGQAGSGGIADVLSGTVCPGGKLAESWPLKLEDTPCYHYFPGGGKTVEYRESLFVGYRYYDTAGKAVAWPFGFGLSYTTFAYSDIAIDGRAVSFTIENTGGAQGAEAAQVYLGLPGSKVFRPRKWLAGFEKVRLAPGERKTVRIVLDDAAFAYYNVPAGGWRVEGGTYTVSVGASVNDILLTAGIEVAGDGDEAKLSALSGSGYFNVRDNRFSDADFTALYGKVIPPAERLPGEPYTVNTPLGDIKDTPIGAKVMAGALKQAADMLGGAEDKTTVAMIEAVLNEMPLRGFGMMSGGELPPDFAELMVATLNGNWFSRTFATIKLGIRVARYGKNR
jgi:beta-glucosidase